MGRQWGRGGVRPGRAVLLAGASNKAQPVTSLTATNDAVAGNVNVAWVNPTTLYTGIQIERNLDGGAYSVIATLSVGTTTYQDTAGYSMDAIYRVTTLRSSGINSDPVSSGTVRTLPNIPSVSGLTATNPGNVILAATSPGGSKIAGFDVQLSTDNGGSWGSTVDTGADPSHTFTAVAHGQTCRVRVRTRDTLSQVSAWAQWVTNVVSVNDVTGPVVPVPTAFWDGGPDRNFKASWTAPTDALTGVYDVYLEARYDGGAWEVALLAGPGARTNVGVYLATANRGKRVEYRLTAIDNVGNTTVGGVSASYYSKPLGTFFVAPIESATFKTAGTDAWRGDTDDVISGYLDATYDRQYGSWFYGATAISDVCKGFSADEIKIIMVRDGSSGSSGANAIQQHSNATKPSGSTFLTLVGSSDAGPTLTGPDALANYVLPSSWYANFASGASKGIATVTDPATYRRLQGRTDNGYSGILTLTFAE